MLLIKNISCMWHFR